MKFEVIGWTYYENRAYPEHKGDHGAVNRAVIQAIREGGYRFGGNSHEDAMTGVPVLNDGTKACYSWRGWGMIMALALELKNEKGYAYMQWYMDTMDELLGGPRRERVLPPWGVDDRRIQKRSALTEVFEMHLVPEAFHAVAAGKKTVELRLYDEKRQCICRGDLIDFVCGEERVRVHVTNTDIYDNFEDLFDPDRLGKGYEHIATHKRSLVRRARFGEYKTPEALRSFLFELYPEEKRKPYRAFAISFRLGS